MARSQEYSLYNEAQSLRLRALADSVNETARMARTTLSILLIVALYLALTLFASTDENLLRQGQVKIPQLDMGLPVVQSHIFAPLIFLFLHSHALLMLSVLARKMRTFEVAVREDILATKGSHARATKRKEYRDWLSSFAFVQRFQRDAEISCASRVISSLATSAIPLTLLFIIDISFVRYQNTSITRGHHIIFLSDLVLVVLFYWKLSGQRVVFNPRLFGQRVVRMLRHFVILAKRIVSNSRLRGPRMMKLFRWVGKLIYGLIASFMVLLLYFAAHPPGEDESPQSIWQNGKSITLKELFGTILGSHNFLDVVPCRLWAMGCRYLDVRNLKDQEEKFSLVKRNLRFARFDSAVFKSVNFSGAQLQGANFSGQAQLQGVILQNARLQGANFSRAQLQGAYFSGAHFERTKTTNFYGANLQRADFFNTKLQGAYISGVDLQGAYFQQAQVQGMDLRQVKLQGADLSGAQLQGTDLQEAQLQGANLSGAELEGANLSEAQLQGADLSGAKLEGANLSGAQLQGADLLDAQLEGVNLKNAGLQCISGKPAKWRLAWLLGTQYNFPSSPDRKNACSSLPKQLDQCVKEIIPVDTVDIKLKWNKSVILKEHLKKRLKDCPNRQIFDGAKPDQKDMIFYDHRWSYDQRDWSGPLKDWLEPVDIKSQDYSNAWTKWTVEFACLSVHTARSSFGRWNYNKLGFRDKKIIVSAKRAVLKALFSERENRENCRGINDIPAEEWGLYLDEWKRFEGNN